MHIPNTRLKSTSTR